MKRQNLLDLASPLWTEHMGRSTAPVQKRLLIRELAWRVQAREHGGLDAQTRKLLATAMRDALRRAKPSGRAGAAYGEDTNPEEANPDIRSKVPLPSSLPRRRVARKAPAPLAPATRLIRMWRGVRHEVNVLDGGSFRYRGQTFKSLSEVARAITGARWSGPRFFGISTRIEGSHEP